MDMSTPCPRCGEVVELDDMVSHPNEFKTLVCEDCRDKIEEENNRGSETDSFGNVIKWHACPDDGLISFSVNSVEVADWSYEDDPEFTFQCFMNIWNMAQSTVKTTRYRLNTSLPNLTVGKVYDAVLDGIDLIGSYDDTGETVIIQKQFLVEVK